MKISNKSSIPTTIALIVLALTPLIFYFSGCVAVPDQPVVASGSMDKELDRQSPSCGSILDPSEKRKETGGIDPSSFAVLSWNSHRGGHKDWNRDLIALGSDADIILLQEAALEPVLDTQLDIAANQWLMATAFHLDDREIGVMSAARVAPQAYCVAREPEPLFKIPKIGLAAAYRFAGLERSLLVVNIHIVNYTIDVDAVQRQIGALEQIVRTHEGPVIVAGDFNTWNNEREDLVLQKMNELGMSSVSFEPDHRVSFFNHKVDGVFYRGLEVTKSLSHQVESSDHNPLEVHFRLYGG
ncbi:MAG: endonuclease/exonuclease/phosphatase family protein [Desulfofustis sp.]|nr:endonuclease/exonuclease/phosphatase family protein [Desulfofustis sp.]MBT8346687.1 endonuclease/exonuclease/phosphatase family protein [Desulfofustis sp.]NNK58389.1 endonuclease/exonuclease/phosphatase family protein [Desulfofustis sp.]